MNIQSFLIYYAFMLAGIIFHLLLKFSTAYQRPDYAWKIFVKRNWTGALLGWFAGSILVVLLSLRGEPQSWMNYLLSITFGYMGSSMLKNLLKSGKTYWKSLITKILP